MTDFDYKKHSLQQLNTWVRDALISAEVSPQEIYDVIKGVVNEEYYYFKHHTGRCYELLALLNGNGRGHIQGWDKWEETYYPEESQKSCDKDDPSPECKGAWNDFWNDSHNEALTYGEMVSKGYEMTGDGFWIPPQKDKVVRWQLPVQLYPVQLDGLSGEYYVQFPDDLLEAANLKEGDTVEWVEQGDGSYLLRKV